ncbi:MAG TPA: ParB/RepB/Spo0J family partition protein [Nitrospiraceae bacterium]|jgi:ParB family chromosome partitioning protein|nr:ParB/RepB/Spo0J family partition protein [Nitrospiraceae bacterium]
MEKKALGKGLDALLPSIDNRTLTVDRGETQELGVDSIIPNRFQPRQHFNDEEISQLAESIRKNGLLQPIMVRRKGDGVYELIAGERRLRAAKQAGLQKISAVVRNCGDQEAMVLALVENLQRNDLNPMETARAYHRMLNEFGFTQDMLAQRVGKERSSVANVLRLLNLPPEVQRLIESGQLSTGHAKALLGVENPDAQVQLARRIVDHRLSVREVEEIVVSQTQGRRRSQRSRIQPLTSDIEQRLQKRFGTRVNVVQGRRGGRIIIHFFSAAELEGLLETLLS